MDPRVLETEIPADYRLTPLQAVPNLAETRRLALARAARAALPGLAAGRGTAGTLALPLVALQAPAIAPDPASAAQYAHLIGAPGTDSLPAGYPHVLGFPLSMALLTRADFPLPVLGMVHLQNRIRRSGPTRFADALHFTTWAAHLRPHRRGALVDIHLAGAVDGDVVWHGVSTYLAKGITLPGEESELRASWDLAPLEATGLHQWHLDARVGRRYAEVSGDANPIHTSRIGARAFGFKRPIAHGMYTAARALAALPCPPPSAGLDWSVTFGSPVFLPARVSLEFQQQGSQTSYALVRRGGESTRVHLSGTVQPLE